MGTWRVVLGDSLQARPFLPGSRLQGKKGPGLTCLDRDPRARPQTDVPASRYWPNTRSVLSRAAALPTCVPSSP